MEAKKPDFSIIIPTYNRKESLAKAVESILAQTFKSYEILIINDGGDEITGFDNTKIKVFNLAENKGRSIARNFGLKESTGQYLCLLDDDDIFYPNHLETHFDFYKKNPQYKVAYSSSYMSVLNTKEENKIPFLSEKFDFDALLVNGFIPILSVSFSQECIQAVGLFDESMSCNEDWDFWIRMGYKYDFGNIPTFTNEFFVVPDKNLDEYYKTRSLIYERYKSKNRYYQVETERNKVLNQMIKSPNYYYEKALVFFNQEKYKETIALMTIYLKSIQFDKKALLIISQSLEKLGDLKTSQAYYQLYQKQMNLF